jgi:hypothetical protein
MKNDLKNTFDAIRSIPLEVDPFLETRVLAELRGRKSGRHSLLIWKRFAFGSSALTFSILLLSAVWLFHDKTYEAFVNKPFVVRIELKNLDQTQIAKAEIELPDNVYFDVAQYPELKEQRTLSLHWTKRDSTEAFPFVLSATESGMKTVKVRFLSENNEVVATRVFNIRLKAAENRGQS